MHDKVWHEFVRFDSLGPQPNEIEPENTNHQRVISDIPKLKMSKIIVQILKLGEI